MNIFEQFFDRYIGVIFFGLIVIAVYAFYADMSQREKWFKECLADGRKEYECGHLMYRGTGSTLAR